MATRHFLFIGIVLLLSAVAFADGPNFADLPRDLAIVRSEGNGKRVFALFEDPFCPACKYFESQLDGLTDYTVYIYTYPILGKRSVDTATAVWCSSNPLGTWENAVRTRSPLAADSKCLNTVGRILEMGAQFGVHATPTLVFENNTAVAGALPAKQLSALLNKASGTSTTVATTTRKAPTTASGPKLIEIPGVFLNATPQPKSPALFLFKNGEKLESEDYMVTRDDIFVTVHGEKRRYPVSSLDQSATKSANIERGIVISFPKSASEFNLNF